MRNLIVHLRTGYCGEDAWDILRVPEDWTDENISDEAWSMACQHAESYGHPSSYDLDEEDLEIEEYVEDWLSNHVSADWEDYIPEKHDMYRSGGGSFSEEFK